MGMAADATKLSDNMRVPQASPTKLDLALDRIEALRLGQ
jgi:hypothetical protein